MSAPCIWFFHIHVLFFFKVMLQFGHVLLIFLCVILILFFYVNGWFIVRHPFCVSFWCLYIYYWLSLLVAQFHKYCARFSCTKTHYVAWEMYGWGLMLNFYTFFSYFLWNSFDQKNNSVLGFNYNINHHLNWLAQ